MKNEIRYIGAKIIAILFIYCGLATRIKKKAHKGDFILSIYFHSPSKPLFEFCVKWLKKNRFQFLSQQDVLEIAQKDRPFPKGGVIITLDDGWQSNKENVVEVANRHQIPVTIFVSTNPVEIGDFWWSSIKTAQKMGLSSYSIEALKKMPNQVREKIVEQIKSQLPRKREALTIEEIKKINSSKFVTIGGHTVSHPILINCNDDEVLAELTISKEKLQQWVNSEVNSFAYPNGDYGQREINYLKRTGYTLSYTTEASYLTENRLRYPYEIPRFCIFENISKAEAICRMLGIWQRFIN